MIKASNIVKQFGKFNALDGLTLNVQKGSVYGLVGPNGAGKTTFIKSLMGIYRVNEGKITVNGEEIFENCKIKEKMICISDDLFFYPTYSIQDMANFYAGVYHDWNWEYYEKLKEIFRIDTKRKARRLSKGMQKQVAFWLGLCTMPDYLILDEPVDGLDPVMRRNVWKLMLQAVADREMTVLVSSHNLRELEDVCDHVGFIHQGKMVIEKSLDDVKGNVHKLQLAFKGGAVPEELLKEIDVLDKSGFASVSLVIAKGNVEDIRKKVGKYNPLIFDIIPLTLEEVFIYELGGMGYEFQNIML